MNRQAAVNQNSFNSSDNLNHKASGGGGSGGGDDGAAKKGGGSQFGAAINSLSAISSSFHSDFKPHGVTPVATPSETSRQPSLQHSNASSGDDECCESPLNITSKRKQFRRGNKYSANESNASNSVTIADQPATAPNLTAYLSADHSQTSSVSGAVLNLQVGQVGSLAARREAFIKGEPMPASMNGHHQEPRSANSKIIIANGDSGFEGRSRSTSPTHHKDVDSSNGVGGGYMPTASATGASHRSTHTHSIGLHQNVTRPGETVIGYVGFDRIPNQVYRRAVKQGFEFSLMVVGQSGLGKSTFINSLFLSEIYNLEQRLNKSIPPTTEIEENGVKLQEKDISLSLTLVDTPGFGDAVDNSNCWDPVINHIERKYTEYLTEETKINRSSYISDKRIHCCLYFIAPSGHSLKPLDVEFMKRLHDRVNIIPVIAKADTLTSDELRRFKKTVMEEIQKRNIKIYQFPEPDSDEENRVQKPLRNRVPFALVASNTIMDVNGQTIRARKYPWGVVEVENLEHNDFVALRNMLIRTHMIDLMEVTRCVHYENFRCRQLLQSDGADIQITQDPFTQMDLERREHEKRIAERKSEMESVLKSKVQQKEKELEDYSSRIDKLEADHMKQLERRRAELQENRSRLIREKEDFKKNHPDFHRYTSSESLKENNLSPPGYDEKKANKKKAATLGNMFRGTSS